MRFFLTLAVGSLMCVEAVDGAITTSAPPKVILPGAEVVDALGNPVGTVQSVHGSELIIKTDRHEVRLPARSFTPDKGKLVFGMTRDALNRATDAILAKALVPGAPVHGKNGALVGQIEALDDRFVTVDLQSGERIRLPRNAVGPGRNGAVLGITTAELEQMIEQSQAQTP